MSINKDLEVVANQLEDKILIIFGESLGYNSFTIHKWKKKYGKLVLWQVVNKLCLKAIRSAYKKGRASK